MSYTYTHFYVSMANSKSFTVPQHQLCKSRSSETASFHIHNEFDKNKPVGLFFDLSKVFYNTNVEFLEMWMEKFGILKPISNLKKCNFTETI